MGTAQLQDFAQRNVGDIVAEDYTRAAILKQFGIDFCCGGGRPLAIACEKAGVDLAEVEARLRAGSRAEVGWPDPSAWDTGFLMDYIIQVHHRYVRDTIPVLRQFCDKVARVHGETHDYLVEIRDQFHELADGLQEHMAEEETVLFPHIRGLTAGDLGDGPAPIQSFEDDHEHAGAVMKRIRELTNDFQAPDEACATWRGSWAKLEEFETDLHRHVHLENNLLFPKAVALQGTELAGSCDMPTAR